MFAGCGCQAAGPERAASFRARSPVAMVHEMTFALRSRAALQWKFRRFAREETRSRKFGYSSARIGPGLHGYGMEISVLV